MINVTNFKFSIPSGFKRRVWLGVAIVLFSSAASAQTYPVSGVWVATDDRFPGSTGDACLETPAHAVASSLADLHSRGHRVVAIVSAMGKTTDELVRMAYQVSPHPNRRELDMLLPTGERIGISLMSMALSDLGVPAISFTGSQAGVMTDESHSSARILDGSCLAFPA